MKDMTCVRSLLAELPCGYQNARIAICPVHTAGLAIPEPDRQIFLRSCPMSTREIEQC